MSFNVTTDHGAIVKVVSDSIFGRVEYESQPPLWPWFPPRAPSKCPVCEGRGSMPLSFYSGRRSVPGDPRVKCRSCDGRGIVH